MQISGMATTRPSIPKAASEEALRAFSHMCAACGERKPHLHHIDGNSGNNDPLNLIPLCPNHHLTDAHDPTRPIEPGRLRLLRLYRDPTVLDSRFQPIFVRLESFRRYLNEPLGEGGVWTDGKFHLKAFDGLPNKKLEWFSSVFRAGANFCRFLAVLEMGDYYAPQFERIFRGVDDSPGFFENPENCKRTIYAARLYGGREKIVEQIEQSILEMMRYQGWHKSA